MSAIIRVCDLETCGLEPPAEVCEVGYCDLVLTDAGWEVGRPVSWLCGVTSIPPETRAVHHITPAEVAGKPPFDATTVTAGLADYEHAVVAAHSADFEAKWLGLGTTPLLCTWKAALRVWPSAPSHSNAALRYWLDDQGAIAPEHALTIPPHRAGPDAYVTAWILKALLDTGVTAREMVGWTREPALLPTCPIGEWRGKQWAEIDAGFLRWMVNKPVEPDLVWNARRELDRRSAAA